MKYMELMMTEEQKDLRNVVVDFCEKEIAPQAAENDRIGEYPMELFKKAAAMGLTSLTVPKRYGGSGVDTLTYAIMKEEISKADAGFSTGFGGCNLGCMAVRVGGSEEQMEFISHLLINGGITAFCLTEAEAGSDTAAIRTAYKDDGDHVIINGVKTFITNGGIADMHIVFATKDRALGPKGQTCFLVDAKTPGVSVGKEEDKLGIRCSNTTEVVFTDVRVPKKNIIGEEGQGYNVAIQTLNRTRPSAGMSAIGNAQGALEYAVEYAKERKTFGKPISKYQGISFKLAQMEILLQAARQYTYHACRLMDKGVVASKIFSGAKAFASDAGMKVCTEAVQVVGGYGYMKDYPLEKRMRDAKIFQIFEGTNEIQRMIIAGELLRGGSK